MFVYVLIFFFIFCTLLTAYDKVPISTIHLRKTEIQRQGGQRWCYEIISFKRQKVIATKMYSNIFNYGTAFVSAIEQNHKVFHSRMFDLFWFLISSLSLIWIWMGSSGQLRTGSWPFHKSSSMKLSYALSKEVRKLVFQKWYYMIFITWHGAICMSLLTKGCAAMLYVICQTHSQTSRQDLKIWHTAGYFWQPLTCLEMWSNTPLSVWFTFSIKTKKTMLITCIW